jgi:hypothetical protein
MTKEKTPKPERRNRFDKTVEIELSVNELDKGINDIIDSKLKDDSLDLSNNESPQDGQIANNSDIEIEGIDSIENDSNTDSIEQTNMISPTEDSQSQQDTTLEQPEQVSTVETTTIIDGEFQNTTQIISSYTALSNLKSNDVISKMIKRTQDKDELSEKISMFPNKNKNEIVSMFIEEILKQREKEIRKKMLGYKKKKSKSFKESKETFSMPVRPEMKELLNLISLFSGSNKYIFFEDLIIRACQNFDFEKDFYDDENE